MTLGVARIRGDLVNGPRAEVAETVDLSSELSMSLAPDEPYFYCSACQEVLTDDGSVDPGGQDLVHRCLGNEIGRDENGNVIYGSHNLAQSPLSWVRGVAVTTDYDEDEVGVSLEVTDMAGSVELHLFRDENGRTRLALCADRGLKITPVVEGSTEFYLS